MGKISVIKNVVFVDRPLSPENGETSEEGFCSGVAENIVAYDPTIEPRSYRKHLEKGEGDISIVIEAGDEWGEIRVGLQFEGPPPQSENDDERVRAYNEHLGNQNEVLQQSAEWLRQIFSEFEADFQAEIATQACPGGDPKLVQVSAFATRIEGRLDTEARTEPSVDVQVRSTISIDKP